MLGDKDHLVILSEIARVGGTVIATEARSSRSVARDELADEARALGMEAESIEGVEFAVERAQELASEADLICVTGSHYVVGEARDLLLPSDAETSDIGKR